jgi:hypothetical protein
MVEYARLSMEMRDSQLFAVDPKPVIVPILDDELSVSKAY